MEESTSPTTTDGPGGLESHLVLDPYKPTAFLVGKPRSMGGAYAAAGLPAVAVAAGAENGSPSLFDLLGSMASNWPLGGLPGFIGSATVASGLGILVLKQKVSLGRSGPINHGGADRVGFATPKELRKWLSVAGLRARADVLRPSLAGIRGRSITPHDVGYHLGTDLLYKRGLYIACEDIVLMYAPPRMGKSAQLGNAVIDSVGACVVTTTRSDLYENTHELRRQHNRPVWVFNAGVSGVSNTLRWNLVQGCEDPAAAIRRAGYILSASASGEDMENASFWEGHSFTVLSSYLMAAALKGGDLMTVRGWVTSPTEREPLEILQAHHARVPAGWAQLLDQMLRAPERTRDSVYLTLVRSFQFMSHPEVQAIVSPRPGEQRFDPHDFLRSRGTLYVMGRDMRYGSVSPLFSALVGEIYDAAYVLADNSPGGRLDPYLRMVLDEAAVICPLPLHLWSADAGGRNLQLLIAVQSPSQLRERWGQQGAQTIMNNSVRVVLGGLSLPQDLEELSQLCGEKDEEIASSSEREDQESRSVSVRRVRVMPQDAIRQMREGTGLVFYRHLPPIRYRFTPVWERKDVKAQVKAAKARGKMEARLKRKGVPLADPVLPPQMPASAPDAPPAASPGIPGQWGQAAGDDERWRYTG
ncbi:type IV secretory system conjugative DNA transfer family protein [Streptomyces chartreusis]|uniref:type IV secretory system conjugative DNA transfer family protein n=1 Tax=Streptomyces chartreusis TaxID=1969 RepID=UPI002F90FB92|nr:type IV secretory system conjugative DNA transfer family protein [Streptomyces chartreusis]